MADREVLLSLAGPVLAGYLTDGDTLEVMANDNGTCYVTRWGVGTVAVAHPGWEPLDRFLSAIAHEVGQEWRATSPRLSAALEDVGWRLQAGLPPLALLALAGCTVAPIALLGTWWLTPCTALLGLYIAYEARRDPQFLLTWAGELRFKARYH